MSKERDYNKIDALKYLVEKEFKKIDEWTEVDMYHILRKVILEENKRYTKEILDALLESKPYWIFQYTHQTI